MKGICCLILAMLIASPALGQFTREEAKILLDASARMTADIETIKAELAVMNGANEIRVETQPNPFVVPLLIVLGTALGTWQLMSILDNHSRRK